MATLISYKKTGEWETTAEVNGRHNDAFIADEGEEQVDPVESNFSSDRNRPLGLWRRAVTEQRTNFRDSNLSGNDVAIRITGDKRQPVCLSSGDTSEDQFEIEWANLKLEMERKWYQKANQKGQSLILRGVDGRIKSGEMTAVLGPSGAGKTSLLNSLFGKYRTLVRGSIKVTGAQSKKHLNVSTIPQQDHLIGYLTTEEALWFASRLKNTDDHFDHDANIERVLALLGLERCRATRINKLSGGQHKRVSIAQEMLSSPDVLVLDEPTSGLDSLTCYRTVKVLRSLVEASKANQQLNPMSIILTIHQPQVEVLALFHSVYVMAVGGQTLFQGSPGELGQVIEQQIEPNKSSAGYNDASTIVEIASEQFGRETIDVMVANQRKRFRASTRHPLEQQNYHHESYTHTKKDIDARIMTSRRARNSGVFWRHVGLMTRRCLMSNIRDPLFFLVRVGSHIFLPILYAFVFGSKVGLLDGCPTIRPEIDLLEFALADNDDKIQEGHDVARIQFQNIGLHFIMAWGFSMAVVGFVALSFPLIMHVLIKEIRNGWYSLGAFFVGKWLAELPMAIILPPISVGIIQLTTGQPSSYLEWRYFAECLILILIIMLSEAKGLIFGPIFISSMETSVFVASLSTVPFILVAGFFTRIRDIPYVLQQFSKVSYFTYAIQAIIISRYGFGLCPCGESLIPAGGISRIVGIPDSIISMADYYVSSRTDSDENSTTSLVETTADSGPLDSLRLANITDPGPADEQSPPISGEHQSQGLLFDKLARLLSKADAFGYTIHDCSEVESYAMKDMQLKDEMLAPAIVYLVLFIILFKLVGYFVIEKCIRLKL